MNAAAGTSLFLAWKSAAPTMSPDEQEQFLRLLKPQEVIESGKERGHSLTSWRRFDFASSMISSPPPERIVLVV